VYDNSVETKTKIDNPRLVSTRLNSTPLFPMDWRTLSNERQCIGCLLKAWNCLHQLFAVAVVVAIYSIGLMQSNHRATRDKGTLWKPKLHRRFRFRYTKSLGLDFLCFQKQIIHYYLHTRNEFVDTIKQSIHIGSHVTRIIVFLFYFVT